MSVRVDTGTYLCNHGHTPRGRGLWMFEFFWSNGHSTEWMAPRQMTFTEAMVEAKKEARRNGAKFITVLP